MDQQHDDDAQGAARMLFLGDERLADGFRLIGFEAHADPDPRESERILRELSRARCKAFIIVDERVLAQDIPSLRRIRREGGRIVVIAVPPLNAEPRLASEVAERLNLLFGKTRHSGAD
ncbi:MAG: ATPase [Chromatiaceae bacterium]|nr:ATPase [Chromatiaceae bacterium]